ncbi:winged helix-turn-helix domain-containing protein [Actinospica durhamensis]|uniref:Winged helix-turn-helix domain-containing protein n=1 Tax=Actinospica durhamensis TaxID=1508375 RepID=A0A941EWJ7_9ACTN|nr:BTAD domain-containing putative transcriptional regulator [Actinospica durhamensis]MBR7837738.1 winged helix-turn-helix domain-containing protein [Actinospica durhamensis]
MAGAWTRVGAACHASGDADARAYAVGPARTPARSAPGPGVLALRIFGPLTLTRGGQSLPLRSDRQRRLLALLALHPGRTVSHEEIVRTLWEQGAPWRPHGAPNAAQEAIHVHVTRLRELVGTELVAAEPGGYRLVVEDEQLDLLGFEALAAQGFAEISDRPELAVELLGRALGIARGAVLADLADVFATHPTLVAVTQRRIAVALAHADCAVRVGRAGQAVPYLRALLSDDPSHEGLATRLVTALARSGQRDAAFDLYLRQRSREPVAGDEEISEGDRGLVVARPRRLIPAQLPPAPPHSPGLRGAPGIPPGPGASVFVGRDLRLEQLDRHLLRSARATRLVVLSGVGGSGKTELAVRWGRRSASSFPDGQLFLDLQGSSHLPPAPPTAALDTMLRALGVPGDRIPGRLDEMAALFRVETADRRLLIVLDDARDAAQVRPLISGSPGSAVLVTSRAQLHGLDQTDGPRPRWFTTDALRLNQAAELLMRLLGTTCTPGQARRLAQACGCLPLALRIAAAHLEGRPISFVESYLARLETDAWLRALDLPDDPDPAVHATFQLSYDALDSPEQELFRLISLVPGADFSAGAAAALAGIGLEEAEQRLARLVATHHLVVSRPLERDGGRRYAPPNLLQAYARQRAVATGMVEAPVHRLAAWYLAAVRAAVRAAYPHALRLPDEPSIPVRGSFGDADTAQAWLDAEHRNILAVIDQAAAHGAPGEAWRLAFLYQPHLTARGHARAMLDAGTTALSAAHECEDKSGAEAGTKLGEAASRLILAAAARAVGDLDAAATHIRGGVELSTALGWAGARAVALDELGLLEVQADRPQHAAARFRSNLAIMRSAGNKDGEARALTNLGLLFVVSGRLREGARLLRRALRLRALVGPPGDAVRLHAGLGAAYHGLGELQRANEELHEAVRIGRETGERYFTCLATAGLVGVACDLDDHMQARAYLERTWELVETVGLAKPAAFAALHAGRFELAQGRAVAARRWYDRVLSYGESAGDGYHTAHALIGIAACERAEARPGAAVRAGASALHCAEKSGYRVLAARARLELAQAHAAFGDRARALVHARAGAERARACEFHAGVRTAEQLLATLHARRS